MGWSMIVRLAVGGLKMAASQLPGVIVSLLVAERYFRRQRTIDERKEQVDVERHYRKVVNAFITFSGKRPKYPLYLRDAMNDLELVLKVYNRDFDHNEVQTEAGELAKKIIAEHPQDFEDVDGGWPTP